MDQCEIKKEPECENHHNKGDCENGGISEISSPKSNVVTSFYVNQNPLQICVYCGDSFETLKTLENHLSVHSREGQCFKCEQCDKQYTDYFKLKKHRYTHRYETSIKCQVCSKLFNCLSSFKRHIVLHTGLKPFSCIHCDESFTRRDKVNMHMLSVHGLNLADCLKNKINRETTARSVEENPIDNIITCNSHNFKKTCGLIDTHDASGAGASSVECTLTPENAKSIGSYFCDMCNREFGNVYTLKRHLGSHMSNDEPLKCNRCSRKYRNPNKLNEHMKVHDSAEAIHCEICFKTFCDKSNLRRHKTVHNGTKRFGCDLCQKKFTRKDHLKSHKLLHAWHGQGKDTRYRGTITSEKTDLRNVVYKINSKQKLTEPEIIYYRKLYHNAKKTAARKLKAPKATPLHQCSKCNKTFTKHSNLKRHFAAHVRGQPSRENKKTLKRKKVMRNKNRNPALESIESSGNHDITIIVCGPHRPQDENDIVNTTHGGDSCTHATGDGVGSTESSIERPEWDSQDDNLESYLIEPQNIKSEVTEQSEGTTDNNADPTTPSSNTELAIDVDQILLISKTSGLNYCEICEKDFANIFILKHHLTIHTGEKPFECEECFKRYRDRSKLKEHMKLHDVNNLLHCDICRKRFTDKANLRRHFLVHNTEKAYSCDYCFKKFNRKDHLKNHRLQHVWNDEKPNESCESDVVIKTETDVEPEEKRPIISKYYECAVCLRVYTKKSNLDSHKLSHVNDETLQGIVSDLQCKIKSYPSTGTGTNKSNGSCTTESESILHTSKLPDIKLGKGSSSPIENINQCKEDVDKAPEPQQNNKPTDMIEVSVPRISDGSKTTGPGKNRGRKKKIKVCEEKKMEFVCKQCNNVYGTRLLLRRHQCPNKQILVCEVCDKKFLYLSALRTHQVVHSKDKPFECPVCMKRFALIHHMKSHLMLHSGEKPFRCEECDKRFPTSSDLKKHCFTHTGEKPFSCDVCQKMFKRPCDVTRHKLTHSGARHHVCGYCNKRFTQAPHLNSHLLIHFREFQPAESSEEVFQECE